MQCVNVFCVGWASNSLSIFFIIGYESSLRLDKLAAIRVYCGLCCVVVLIPTPLCLVHVYPLWVHVCGDIVEVVILYGFEVWDSSASTVMPHERGLPHRGDGH